jgi:DNA polymerase-3 subunit alpha
MSKFIHLHVHSEYSLLDGLPKINSLVDRAKKLEMGAVALTDHGSMYGVIPFYKKCQDAKINPIVGCEMYTVESFKEKTPQSFHLILLASNLEGYYNLMKLVTIANLEGFYYRPRIDRENIKKYSSGLIALSSCQSGEIAQYLVSGDFQKAKKTALEYQKIFGEGSYYLEIQKHEYDKFLSAHTSGSTIYNRLKNLSENEKKILDGIVKLSKATGIPQVATNDVHYLEKSDAQAQDVLNCIQTGKTISEENRMRMIDSPTFDFKTQDEMKQLFKEFPQALKNTVEIAKKCKLEIPLGIVDFPSFDVPENETPSSYLTKKAFEGIKKRAPKVTEEIKKRIEYELSVIIKKGYATYFLVVADYVNWARNQKIIYTTRGSAAGSLVSYALGITTVDPLIFSLPFERFLNPYRPSLPDLDIDFADNRRDEVIEYVKTRYGFDKVAQITTFGTMMAKAAVRDVARVLGWPYSKADRIAKLIPFGSQGFPMTIEEAKRVTPELDAMYRTDGEVKELLDLAQKIEGNARHASVHAAGIVIAPKPLTFYTPLQRETSGDKVITQYEMHAIEDVGLPKFDFLGIRNLSILQNAVAIIRENKNVDITLEEILWSDKKAFEMVAKGQTMGLFQLGGTGMTRYLKELKPSTIYDIMAMIALFRPGPMESIPEYIARKHGKKKVEYLDPRLEPILKNSFGVITYQDDVLEIAITLAGYNWETVDAFRKAIGKKIPSEMAKQETKFVEGCQKFGGLSRAKAEKLWKLFDPFKGYGFNKAHAASYAVVAYQTAYLKSNFPVEFMTAVMTAEADDTEKVTQAVSECKNLKIPVLPPDVNSSKTGFTIEKDTAGKEGIRFGLSAIKNVGVAAISEIVKAREEKGDFTSLSDFCLRVSLRVVNRKTLESLIKAGAMDRFGNRNSMLKALDDIKKEGQSLSRRVAEGQAGLFEGFEEKKGKKVEGRIETFQEAPKNELLLWERELLGFYLTENPLTSILPQLANKVSHKISILKEEPSNDKPVIIGGIVTAIRHTFTKTRGDHMAFVKLEDETGQIEIVVFPRIFVQIREKLVTDKVLIFKGKTNLRDETLCVIADDIVDFESEDVGGSSKEVLIHLPKAVSRELLTEIYNCLKTYPGEVRSFLVLIQNDEERKIPVPFKVDPTGSLTSSLEELGCKVDL